jgi:hypothetical protein
MAGTAMLRITPDGRELLPPHVHVLCSACRTTGVPPGRTHGRDGHATHRTIAQATFWPATVDTVFGPPYD